MNRYENIKKINNRLKTIRFPTIPISDTDTVVVSNESDRLDILAERFYGNQKLYWIIGLANNLGKGSLEIPRGITIRIPQNFIEIYNNYLELNS